MKKITHFVAAALILFGLGIQTSFAWNHSIELGYGYSHDPNNVKYNNSGVMLSGDLFPLYRSTISFWSITAALGQWYSTAPHNKNLTTGAISLALRYYPFIIFDKYPSYLLASAGPALLSNKKFSVNTQASNLTIQTNLGIGMEFNCIDANLRLEHFSNANIDKPNEGFNILYLLSIGYLF